MTDRIVLTTAVDPAAIPGNRGHKYDASPALCLHVLDDALHQDERRPQVDVDGVVELLERDVPHLRDAFAVPGVRDQNIGSLAVLAVDLLEHSLDLLRRGHIHLVDGEAETRVLRLEFLHQRRDGGHIAGICQRKVDASLSELASTCGSNPARC